MGHLFLFFFYIPLVWFRRSPLYIKPKQDTSVYLLEPSVIPDKHTFILVFFPDKVKCVHQHTTL